MKYLRIKKKTDIGQFTILLFMWESFIISFNISEVIKSYDIKHTNLEIWIIVWEFDKEEWHHMLNSYESYGLKVIRSQPAQGTSTFIKQC